MGLRSAELLTRGYVFSADARLPPIRSLLLWHDTRARTDA